jgi:hypothetical protein
MDSDDFIELRKAQSCLEQALLTLADVPASAPAKELLREALRLLLNVQTRQNAIIDGGGGGDEDGLSS